LAKLCCGYDREEDSFERHEVEKKKKQEEREPQREFIIATDWSEGWDEAEEQDQIGQKWKHGIPPFDLEQLEQWGQHSLEQTVWSRTITAQN
jgi:hypothetical protein